MNHNSAEPADNLDLLEEKLAYRFQDRSLLERALTHRSWAHEHVGQGEAVSQAARRLHNEALEFVGDSVLGLAIAGYLFETHPDLTEGDLSRMKHGLVSAATLARAAKRMELSEFVRVGRGEEKTGGRRKRALLADALEALLAAVYLDGGFDAATAFVYRVLEPELSEATPEAAAAADFKTLLQERVQAAYRATPVYEVIETEGPPHRRVFHVDVTWDGGPSVRGEGQTIKTAEMCAARRALEQVEVISER
ncbi:MAG: ribonuclease III [Pyrinomonadaceae bacterium]